MNVSSGGGFDVRGLPIGALRPQDDEPRVAGVAFVPGGLLLVALQLADFNQFHTAMNDAREQSSLHSSLETAARDRIAGCVAEGVPVLAAQATITPHEVNAARIAVPHDSEAGSAVKAARATQSTIWLTQQRYGDIRMFGVRADGTKTELVQLVSAADGDGLRMNVSSGGGFDVRGLPIGALRPQDDEPRVAGVAFGPGGLLLVALQLADFNECNRTYRRKRQLASGSAQESDSDDPAQNAAEPTASVATGRPKRATAVAAAAANKAMAPHLRSQK